MFCRLVIIVLLVLVDLRVHAATLRGLILENELGGRSMENVEVEASGSNLTESDSSGKFTLEFPQRRIGDTVRIIVKKEGYMVVNDGQLQLALPTDAAAAPLTIILAKEADREEMVRRFYGLHGGQNDSQFATGTAISPVKTLSKSEGVSKSYPFLIYMARWDLFRSFMRWDAFPKDYKALLETLVVNSAVATVIYFLSVIALYGIAPAKFAAWHEWIANRGIPFSENVSTILAPFLLDTPHCLNAVVRRYQQRARQLFDKAPEVKTRPKWVAAPLIVGDELLGSFEPPPAKPSAKPYVAGLQEIKARLAQDDERWIISIEGPGGLGKSALAFEIARWASDSRAAYRLASFPMLPVLLGALEMGADKAKAVDDAVAAELQRIMNVPKISDRLLRALLHGKHVLAVLDGFSETSRDTEDVIRPDKGTVYTQALVITSRIATNLPDSLIIKPQGLTLAFLDRVLDGLIAANLGPDHLYDCDREKLRGRIMSSIQAARDGATEMRVPIIFLKLMIDRADQLLKEGKKLDELPTTLAELVTDYTEQLLRKEKKLTLTMQQARTAAHVCMGQERVPGVRSEGRYTLAEVPQEILDKFVTAGLMVRSGEKSDPFYKFALDPMAEQLDANRLVIDIREKRADQTELDDLTQRWKELPEDFVRALRRAAARYRQEICASYSAISIKLWPHEMISNDPAPQMSTPRHSLAIICKAALVVPDFLREIRRQPWKSILQYVDGAELVAKIFGSTLEPGEPAGIAAFFASLPKAEAAILSFVLGNKELNEQMGHLFWTHLAAAALQRRKRQIKTVLRIAGDDPAAQQQANEELKGIVDLESWFTDISRLPAGAP